MRQLYNALHCFASGSIDCPQVVGNLQENVLAIFEKNEKILRIFFKKHKIFFNRVYLIMTKLLPRSDL